MNIFNPMTLVGIHSLLSVVALVSGIPVVVGLLRSRIEPLWTVVFLITAVATSISGFGLPAHMLLPSHVVGILSLLVLAATIFAQYQFHLAGSWRWIYAAGAVAAEYFLVFVAIAQAFFKVPPLAQLAASSPTPFAATQLAALVVFIGLCIAAMLKFRPGSTPATAPEHDQTGSPGQARG